jgi:hypothetical protein
LPHGIVGDSAIQMSARILVNMVSIDLLQYTVSIQDGGSGKVTILSILVDVFVENGWSVFNGLDSLFKAYELLRGSLAFSSLSLSNCFFFAL